MENDVSFTNYCKPGESTMASLKQWLRRRMSTVNSDVAIQTRSTYLYLQKYDKYHQHSNGQPGFSTT